MNWLDLIPNLLAAAIGAVAVRGYRIAFNRYRFRHLSPLLPKSKTIQMVIPTTVVTEFHIREIGRPRRLVKSAPNVLWVPLGASLAATRFIARLVPLLRSSYRIVQVPDSAYDPEMQLSIAFGGQYVNDLSNLMIRRYLPDLHAEHENLLHIAGHTLSAMVDHDGVLQDDYGFLLITRDGSGRHVVVIWGIHSPGTEIAGRALFEIGPRSEAGRAIRSGANALVITRGLVDGVRVSNIEVVNVVVLEPGTAAVVRDAVG